ncbi:DUF4136 domain-containing protein [Flavobacterium sp. CS20]|jgi:hypothetical protein|uniref:DUF4136 domain-containing protein n=1 Tax=Flavobacterium sp. CS20 TaxID=2775246 RepID=UPI001B3A359C|nr:DUF4136 domain-containing protein [Flavobacterium sp. CS20]QTY26098.1 DUF4136 domain-containing protein [Flavobacterium sp. CS20]
MKKIFVLGFLALLVSCSSTKVFMDYDKDADLKSYKTYNYFLSENTGLSELDEKRVIEAIDSLLPQKGYAKETIPDFNVNFYAEIYAINSQSSIGVGIGGGGGRVGGGVSGGIPINTSKDMIALTIEFVDALNKELFWQAVVETRVKPNQNPRERQAFFGMMVQKALEKYPPEPKTSKRKKNKI